MKKNVYQNPIINSDYSDPDVIRVGEDFFMIASSFSQVPGVPVLHSRNLVDWEIINYVYDKIPFERFKDVQHGHGAWAPAIRYHNETYYAIIPFPDEGIYISSTKDPFGKWSDLWCLTEGKGFIDPCPIWVGEKCYMAIGFAKSRIGFNSCIGIYEVTPDLKTQLTDYKIIYDGRNDNPTIEGPKFNVRNGYYYIMAPAGSVKTGWQLCLRSREIYGPYETKIVMMQGNGSTNGPHQGALLDIDDNDNWAFIHFQDKECYGRVVHLQPVKWVNDWPLCGYVSDEELAGIPVDEHGYIVDIVSDKDIPTSDDFKSNELSYIWQTPANQQEDWYELNNGLKMNCYYHNEKAHNALNLQPNTLLQKLIYMSFDVGTKVDLSNMTNGDETGLVNMGSDYAYVCVSKNDGKMFIQLKHGSFDKKNDNVLETIEYSDSGIVFKMKYRTPNIYQLGYNDKYFENIFYSKPGRWIGTKVGIYAKGLPNSEGFVVYDNFNKCEIKIDYKKVEKFILNN